MAEEIKDISLSSKKSFRIDGDNDRIIYLDVSDMNIIVRLDEAYPEIQKLGVEAQDKLAKVSVSKTEGGTESPLNDISEVLKDIDKKMREKLNYIFASDVADTCEPTGNMYDIVNGEWRFEHILDVLTTLYTDNLNVEFKKMQSRIKKHTAKYTNKRKK